MKVLFLDIDGVLNSQNWFGWRAYYIKNNGGAEFDMDKNLTEDKYMLYKLSMLDPRAIANLNRIIDETGCKVVLSSSWRCLWNPKENDNIVNALKLRGFKYDFYGVTPRIPQKDFGQERGIEIQAWIDKELEKNEIESYLILDDDNDMLPEQMGNFILINGQYGLSDVDVFKAIEILNK
jgi:hypothetical protein